MKIKLMEIWNLISSKYKRDNLEKELQLKENYAKALEENKKRLESELKEAEKTFKSELKIKETAMKELEATIKQLRTSVDSLEPKGNIGIELTDGNSKEFKWVNKAYNLSDNFKVYEFMQNDGLEYLKINMKLVDILQKMREHFQKPISITSGYRSKAYNREVNGSTKSQHLNGKAADIIVKGVSAEDVQEYIKSNYEELGIGGLGMAKGYTHIDVRNKKDGKLTTWTY